MIAFAGASVKVDEGQPAVLSVSRTGGDASTAVSFAYSTLDGDAKAADRDYDTVSGRVSFPTGVRAVSISIPTHVDGWARLVSHGNAFYVQNNNLTTLTLCF